MSKEPAEISLAVSCGTEKNPSQHGKLEGTCGRQTANSNEATCRREGCTSPSAATSQDEGNQGHHHESTCTRGLRSDNVHTRLNSVAVCDENRSTCEPTELSILKTSDSTNASQATGINIPPSPFPRILQDRTMTSPGQFVFGNAPCYARQTIPVCVPGMSKAPWNLLPTFTDNSYLCAGSSRNFSTSPTLPATKKAKTDLTGKDFNSDVSVDEYLVPQLHVDPTGKEDTFEIYDVHREWEYTEYGRAHSLRPKEGVELTVLCYNVLSQSLLEDNIYLYPYCPQELLDWSCRKTKLLEEMVAYQPTILCLQEVESAHYTDFFLPELEARGYEGTFQKRTGSKPDGCAIFVKSDKFKISAAIPISYYKGGLLDRDNVALVTKLTSVDLNRDTSKTSAGSDLYIATTHLLFNPRRGDVKLAQLTILFAELDKIVSNDTDASSSSNISDNCIGVQNSSYAPVIVCGDFNMEPQSDLYKFIVRGYLNYEGLLSRELSGQREHRHGTDVYLPKQLLPPDLGITDQCQYVGTLRQRNVPVPDHVGKVPDESTYSDTSEPVLHGLSDPSALKLGHHNAPLVSQGTGCMWHKLNLVSVYKHTIERLGHNQPEVTTKHDYASCTVDYIFYNVKKKNTHTRRSKIVTRDVEEDKLRLLGRYGLLSSRELGQVGGLPNRNLASDHLGLLAKFLLK